MQRLQDIHQDLYLSTPGKALQLSQQAPPYLSDYGQQQIFPTFLRTYVSDSSDQWLLHEQLLLTCLRTGDDKSAHLCLEKLTERFGPSNERIMALRGLYQEATAADEVALRSILQDYERILAENPVNVPILKRRVALLRSMSKEAEAISALVEFLEAFPTDTEAWCELSDLYMRQGLGDQAIFCLEEALLMIPLSWNLHAHLGEVLYVCGNSQNYTDRVLEFLVRSVRHFCRSIELCDDYVRGFFGLKLATSQLLQTQSISSSTTSLLGKEDLFFNRDTIQKLNSKAAHKLEELVNSIKQNQPEENDRGELNALEELIRG